MVPYSKALVEYGVASRGLPGERESGDRHVVAQCPWGVLFAVVDGLGHGELAAEAASAATAVLRESQDADVVALVKACHLKLSDTRGATMVLVVFDGDRMKLTSLGIGTNRGVLVRVGPGGELKSKFLVSRGGVVGAKLPALVTEEVEVQRGDVLVLMTDGISPSYRPNALNGQLPQESADRILREYGLATDDALVLVARFL